MQLKQQLTGCPNCLRAIYEQNISAQTTRTKHSLESSCAPEKR